MRMEDRESLEGWECRVEKGDIHAAQIQKGGRRMLVCLAPGGEGPWEGTHPATGGVRSHPRPS